MLNNILIASFSTASAAAFEKGEKNYNDFFLKFADYFNSFFLCHLNLNLIDNLITNFLGGPHF